MFTLKFETQYICHVKYIAIFLIHRKTLRKNGMEFSLFDKYLNLPI